METTKVGTAQVATAQAANTQKQKGFLSNPETRASHIAILIVVSLILILAVILLPYAIFRAGGTASSSPGRVTTMPVETPANRFISKAFTKFNSRALTNRATGPTPGYKPIATELVDPLSNGTRFISNMQSVVSSDGRFELLLTADGNAQVWDHVDPTTQENRLLWESKTSNSVSPAQRFLMGIEGYAYLLRNDGSRITDPITKAPWQSPNQFPPFFRKNGTSGPAFNITAPFLLTFYADGLVVYSTNAKNTALTKSTQTRIPIWWVCASHKSPEGVLVDWCPPANCTC